jgi:LuxR family maltose regulon positive regulatory protein
MSRELILTKFIPPVYKQQYIERPLLQRKLRLGLDRKLILISAPPGFGKTTILAEWLSKLKIPYTWLSLDAQDDSLYNFISYFIGAIQKVIPNFGNNVLLAMGTLPQPPAGSIMDSISNELAEISHQLLIVIDDFQFIENPGIHEVMISLLSHLPPTLCLCIATRSDPPWKIARMRTQQSILEIRTNDLRFDLHETSQFIEKSAGIKLKKDDLQVLSTHTEGWPAALQMAAASLQDTTDAHAFIQSFAGSNRAIVDYLAEEVLIRQTEESKEFLIKTSLLDKLSGELCDSVLGRIDSSEQLEALEKANMFLTPLDEEHTWYRYHPLFRELLLHQISTMPPDAIASLHRNASAWFIVHDDPLNSLKHALQAGDLGVAANIAEQRAVNFLDRGQVSEVSGWLASLPLELLQNWPWLIVARAWVEFYMGNLSKIESLLKLAEERMDVLKNPDTCARIQGHIFCLRAHVECARPNPEKMLHYITRTFELLPRNDSVGCCHAYTVLGHYYRLVDKLKESIKAFEDALDCAQRSLNENLQLFAIGNLAFELNVSGLDIERAENICCQVIDELTSPNKKQVLPALVYPMSTLSNIYLNQGEFTRALELCRTAINIARAWQHAEALDYALTVMVEICFNLNDLDGAKQAIDEAKAVEKRTNTLFSQSIFQDEMLYNLQTNCVAPVKLWVEAQQFDFSDVNIRTNHYLLYSQYLLANHDFSRQIEFSQTFIEYFKSVKLIYGHVNILADQACAYAQIGQFDKALENISQIINEGDIKRVTLILHRRGKIMLDLLKLSLKNKAEAERVRQVLTLMSNFFSQEKALSQQNGSPYLVEHLTKRELDILRLLDSGASNVELAKKLVIAPSTVRTHMKSIYKKLGVTRRLEAIHKAKQYRLI